MFSPRGGQNFTKRTRPTPTRVTPELHPSYTRVKLCGFDDSMEKNKVSLRSYTRVTPELHPSVTPPPRARAGQFQ